MIHLGDLAREDIRSELRAVFLDPWSLDPARRAAKVTREVATHLADLARSLEADGTDPEVVARFLMRCLFTMFAEDVALLEDDLFSRTLEDVWIPHPERFPAGIEALWIEMNRGGMYGPHPIRRFNGGLFREVHAMALTGDQLMRLHRAAKCDWSDVEPAIFGTMLERALNKSERHKLGAHFTPRAYIERLVRPTVIDPLTAEWDVVRGAARQVMEPEEGEPGAAERRQAAKLLHDFLIQFAIPDHPWVDSVSGAAVRIALTVVGPRGERPPVLARVVREEWTGDGAVAVDLVVTEGKAIGPDLSVAKNLTTVKPMRANDGLASVGLVLFGKGFVIDESEVGNFEPEVVHPFLNARDLLQSSRGSYVIDMYPMDESESRAKAPQAFARLFDHVRPERLQIRDPASRIRWWRFGRDKPELREALRGLSRYIVTAEISKHRLFCFVGGEIRPDHRLVVFPTDDAWILGVLQSRLHVVWSLAVGGTLEDRPCYNRTLCFDPFPFPDATEGQKAQIRSLGEAIDAHRKRVQAEQPDVWLTTLYNAMARVRDGEAGGAPLDETERAFHQKAMVGLLRSLHDELDVAVAEAYGWPANLSDEEIVDRLVALNASRVEEEERGEIRWLSTELQRRATGTTPSVQQQLDGVTAQPKPIETPKAEPLAWPKDRFAQIKAVRDLLAARPGTHTTDEIVRAFKAGPSATVRRHLDMLERIGVLVSYDDGNGRRWHAGVQ